MDAQANTTFLASAAAAATSQASVCLSSQDIQALRQQVDDAANLALADTTAVQQAKLQLAASMANDAANNAQSKYDESVKVLAAASATLSKAITDAKIADQLAAQAAQAVQVSTDGMLQLNSAFQAATAITDQATADAKLAQALQQNASQVAQLALAFADNVPPGFAGPYILQQMAILEAQENARSVARAAALANATAMAAIATARANALAAAAIAGLRMAPLPSKNGTSPNMAPLPKNNATTPKMAPPFSINASSATKINASSATKIR